MGRRGAFLPWECYAFFHFLGVPGSAFSNHWKVVCFLILGQDTRNFCILKMTMSQRFEFPFLRRDLGIFFVPLS